MGVSSARTWAGPAAWTATNLVGIWPKLVCSGTCSQPCCIARPKRCAACASWLRLRRVAAAPGRVLGTERPTGFWSADPQSHHVPLARRVLGVVNECRAGVHRREVVEELQISRLESHAKSDARSLQQRVEIHETGDLIRGESGHLGEAHR